MFLIISTSFDNLQQSGQFFWGSKYLNSIKPFLPNSIIEIISITEGLIYFNKSELKENLPLKFKITSSALTQNYFKVKYTLTEEKIDYKSFQIRDALKKYLCTYSNKTINSVLDLPFCVAVDEILFDKILQNNSLSSEIENLQQKNKWNEIYNLLEKKFPLEQSPIWNDADILNKFSFATAKLSECSENLKKKFSDKKQLQNYLDEKKKFRKLSIKLRQRCIELDPNNASFLSNLAYTYYQSARELATPNCRKDGNISKDAHLAIEFLNKALEIQPDRITELYRLATIYSDILAPNSLFNKSDDKSIESKIADSKQLIKIAEENFIKIIDIYENSITDSKAIIKNKKHYIKALYHLAQIKLGEAKTNYDAYSINYGDLKIYKLQEDEIKQKTELLNTADEYINRCIIEDNFKDQLEDLIEQGTTNNFIPGIYKLYLKGIIQFQLYLITQKGKHNLTAKEFLYKANETNFPKEMQKQNKIFIIEKLAQIKIVEKKSNEAILLLEPIYNQNRYFPEYAAYTLVIAYLLEKKQNKAKELIDKYINYEKSPMHKKFQKLYEKTFINKTENIYHKISINDNIELLSI